MTHYERRLPHWHPPGHDLFITWRLHGSLAHNLYIPRRELSSGKAFVLYDRLLDSGSTGPLWLRDPRIAEAVVTALQAGHDQNLFLLRAYVLMANHVHVLLEPQASIAKITQQIKGMTARRANNILGRTGARFWQDESFDRWVRNPIEEQKIHAYIENNPVTAGLVKNPQDWPWSSASHPIL